MKTPSPCSRTIATKDPAGGKLLTVPGIELSVEQVTMPLNSVPARSGKISSTKAARPPANSIGSEAERVVPLTEASQSTVMSKSAVLRMASAVRIPPSFRTTAVPLATGGPVGPPATPKPGIAKRVTPSSGRSEETAAVTELREDPLVGWRKLSTDFAVWARWSRHADVEASGIVERPEFLETDRVRLSRQCVLDICETEGPASFRRSRALYTGIRSHLERIDDLPGFARPAYANLSRVSIRQTVLARKVHTQVVRSRLAGGGPFRRKDY